MPHKKLSGTFTAIDIDVQQRVDSLSGFPEAHLPEILWESDNTLKVLATCTGGWNAIVFWFTVSACMYMGFTSCLHMQIQTTDKWTLELKHSILQLEHVLHGMRGSP